MVFRTCSTSFEVQPKTNLTGKQTDPTVRKSELGRYEKRAMVCAFYRLFGQLSKHLTLLIELKKSSYVRKDNLTVAN